MRPAVVGYTRNLEKSTALTYFMHEIKQVNAKRFLPEVFTDHLEDCAFKKEGIVHVHETNALYAVPARLAATGNARVHNVIRYEEVGLELEQTMRLDSGEKDGERDPPIQQTSRGRPP
jgi:hypothetical protein